MKFVLLEEHRMNEIVYHEGDRLLPPIAFRNDLNQKKSFCPKPAAQLLL